MAGAQVLVINGGVLETPGAVLAADSVYYAGPNGTVTAALPISGLKVPVGMASDADTFVVNVGTPILLA